MEQSVGFVVALIFGGMVTFQFLFVPLLFTRLETPIARRFIRAFFPYYYFYFGLLALVGAILSFSLSNRPALYILGLCFIGFAVSRQGLMPKANAATDSGDKKAFDNYHRATVVINTIQLTSIGYLLYQMLSLSTLSY